MGHTEYAQYVSATKLHTSVKFFILSVGWDRGIWSQNLALLGKPNLSSKWKLQFAPHFLSWKHSERKLIGIKSKSGVRSKLWETNAFFFFYQRQKTLEFYTGWIDMYNHKSNVGENVYSCLIHNSPLTGCISKEKNLIRKSDLKYSYGDFQNNIETAYFWYQNVEGEEREWSS